MQQDSSAINGCEVSTTNFISAEPTPCGIMSEQPDQHHQVDCNFCSQMPCYKGCTSLHLELDFTKFVAGNHVKSRFSSMTCTYTNQQAVQYCSRYHLFAMRRVHPHSPNIAQLPDATQLCQSLQVKTQTCKARVSESVTSFFRRAKGIGHETNGHLLSRQGGHPVLL